MSTIYPTPEMIAFLMESELDVDRTGHVRAGKLTSDLLAGRRMWTATRDDPPYVKEGQLGVPIDESDRAMLIIVRDVYGSPIAVVSSRTNWVKAGGAFKDWDSLVRVEPVEKPASVTSGGRF